jgi:hypothetical protein
VSRELRAAQAVGLRPGEPVTRIERVGVAVALALAVVLMWPLRDYVTDDTFIHLRYAQNVAAGQGLVFNPGEPVYGCTSPLWVVLIADGMLLGLDGLVTARLLGFASTLASIVFFMQLMRRTLRTPELRAFATVAWAGHAWMIRWSLSGMETPFAVALTLAGFVAFTEGRQWGSRPVRTGTVWALASLTRPEAVFLLVLWAIFLVVDTDSRAGLRRLAFGLVPPVVIYGGWLLFARLYFGTFWPQTLSAKTAGGEGLEYHLSNLWRQIRIVGASDGVLALLLVAAGLFAFRRLWPGRVIAQRLVPWVWLVAVPALYVARGVPVLSRYLLPLLPILAWLAWRSAEFWWVSDPPRSGQVKRAIAFGAVVAALSLALNYSVYRGVVVPQVTSFSRGLERSLVTWGTWFGRYSSADAVIATPDIGAIGYFSQRRVLDLAGLVTPRMVPLLQKETQEEVIAELRFASFSRPEYLVDRSPEAYHLRERSPYGACLTPLGHASVPNLGIARPGAAVYTFYRVDWALYDEIAASRQAAP